MGAPTKYNPEFHIPDFISKSKQGKHIKQIAAEWEISRDTIYEWGETHKDFSDTIRQGQQLCEAWYMSLGQAAIVGQAKLGTEKIKVDLGFFVWMTKNVCKWSDRSTVEDITPVSKKVSTIKIDAAEIKKKINKIRSSC